MTLVVGFTCSELLTTSGNEVCEKHYQKEKWAAVVSRLITFAFHDVASRHSVICKQNTSYLKAFPSENEQTGNKVAYDDEDGGRALCTVNAAESGLRWRLLRHASCDLCQRHPSYRLDFK